MDQALSMRLLIVLLCSFLLGGCSTNKKNHSDEIIKNQVQVDLHHNMKPARIITSFPSLGLVHLCTISKETNTVIFQFDTKNNSLEHVVALLDIEVGIESAGYSRGCK